MPVIPLRNVPMPEEIASVLRGCTGAFWLDNACGGRYSWAGASPDMLFTWQEDTGVISRCAGDRHIAGHPLLLLRQLLQTYNAGPWEYSAIPFNGGAVGYLGYDLGRYMETLPTKAYDDRNTPLLSFGFFKSALMIDHQAGYAAVVGNSVDSVAQEYRFWLERLSHPITMSAALPKPESADWNVSAAKYCASVAKALEYIAAGDIYQVNFSQRITLLPPPPSLDLYMALRSANPEPYAAYLSFPTLSLAGASPEEFLRKQGEAVITKPIKGTRPRGQDAATDALLASELAHSGKDAAELTMIVDLERNDLGKVAQIGSVTVPHLAVIEKHPHVFHNVATVSAKLRSDCDSIDLLMAAFPGGSITGAPKIRAMEIIDELEPTRRGPYTGACGYITFNGDMLLNIIIRTAIVSAHGVDLHVGGGIVADSTPEGEYAESLDKAAGLLAAWSLRPEEITPPTRYRNRWERERT